MGKVLVTDSLLTDIGDAIRAKTGGNSNLTLAQMADEIAGISTGLNIELLEPLHFDLHAGYVNSGAWYVQTSTGDTYCDVYNILNGHMYLIFLGSIVSTRFRVLFTTVDPASASSTVNGVMVGSDTNDPRPYAVKVHTNSSIYSPSSDGYLTIGKSNNNTSGIITYVLDVTNLFV